jgi:hypothetical protein
MKLALVIGINRYDDASASLTGAVPDALAIAQCLLSVHAFDRVRLLLSIDTGDAVSGPALTDAVKSLKSRFVDKLDVVDQPPTRQVLLDELTALAVADRRNDDDVVAIYYSGHGGSIQVKGGRTGFVESMVGSNHGSNAAFAHVLDVELRSRVAQINARRTNNVVLLFDSCHSGDIAKDELRNVPRVIDPITLTDAELRAATLNASDVIAHLANAPIPPASFVLLAACLYNQRAFERQPSLETRQSRGYFTESLVKALNEKPLSYSELFDRVRRSMASEPGLKGKPQQPFLDGPLAWYGVFASTLAVPLDRRFSFDVDRSELGGGRMHGVELDSTWQIVVQRASGAAPSPADVACTMRCTFVGDVVSRVTWLTDGAAAAALDEGAAVFAVCIDVPVDKRGLVFVAPDALQTTLGAAVVPLLRANMFLRLLDSEPAADSGARVIVLRTVPGAAALLVATTSTRREQTHSLVPPFPAEPPAPLVAAAAAAAASNIGTLFHYDRMLRIAEPPLPWPLRGAMRVSIDTGAVRLDSGGAGRCNLTVANDSTSRVVVAPVLFASDGSTTALAKIDVEPQRNTTVGVQLALGGTSVARDEGTLVLKVFVTEIEWSKVDLNCLEQSPFLAPPTTQVLDMGRDQLKKQDAQIAKWAVWEFPIAVTQPSDFVVDLNDVRDKLEQRVRAFVADDETLVSQLAGTTEVAGAKNRALLDKVRELYTVVVAEDGLSCVATLKDAAGTAPGAPAAGRCRARLAGRRVARDARGARQAVDRRSGARRALQRRRRANHGRLRDARQRLPWRQRAPRRWWRLATTCCARQC